jgi:hypothetical protein
VLEMKWHCDVCQRENVCDVPRETHFLGVIVIAKTDHERINPSCEWVKIHIRLFHPLSSFASASHDRPADLPEAPSAKAAVRSHQRRYS